MERIARLCLLLTVALIAGVLPLQAADCYYKEYDPEGNPIGPRFCSQKVWFHDVAGTKVGNAVPLGVGAFPSWDTNPPTRSVTQGGGGGFFGNGIPRQQNGASDPMFGATFKGTFTGNVDNLDVTLFLFAPGRQNETTYYAGVDLLIDGKTIFRDNRDGFPLSSGGNAVLKTSFVITGIHDMMESEGVSTGDDVRHSIELFVTPYPLATATAVFVYDTTEVPSGMQFNVPGELAGRFTLAASGG